MKIRILFIITFFIFCICAFAFVKTENTSIIINEIGAYEATGYEWIEIFNRGSEAVDISNWKFWEANTNHSITLKQGSAVIASQSFALIVQDDKKFLEKYPTVTTTLFDSAWGSLNEDGEEIGLKFGSGANDFVEHFSYVSSDNFSLERVDPALDVYTSENWLEHLIGNSVGVKNSFSLDPLEEIPPEQPVQESISPVARFTSISSTVSVGTDVFFDASVSTDDGSIVGYSWNFGDGTTAEGMTVIHNFSTTGTFSVELTVIDDQENGSVTSSIQEVVSPIPTVEDLVVPTSTEENLPEVTDEIISTNTQLLVINEFLSNPLEGQEWVELANMSDKRVDLTGVTLFDGGDVIAHTSGTIEAAGFFVIELESSKLNNAGDQIVLKNRDNEIIDRVTYGNWDDGNVGDNLKVPKKGNTLARVADTGILSETIIPTKGEINSIRVPVDVSGLNSSPREKTQNKNLPLSETGGNEQVHFLPRSVVINELLSDPSDDQEEFVELYNTTQNSIALAGWKLEDGSKSSSLLEGNIASHGFFIIEKPKGNLNNGGDTVILVDPSGSVIDKVSYGNWNDENSTDNAPIANDPMSLSRKKDGLDTDSDIQDFSVTLDITRGTSNHINIPQYGNEQQTKGIVKIVFNEILPNPIGDDAETEFIELYNPTTSTVSLVGWRLQDESEKNYTILEKVLEPFGYAVFLRSVTNISLNNTGEESLKLFDANKNLIDTLGYISPVLEDQAYARNENSEFEWTSTKTPGEKNIFSEYKDITNTVSSNTKGISDKKSTKKTAPKKVLGKKIGNAKKILLSQIRDQDKGSLVQVSGIVTALPGILGSQYFYMGDKGSGVQVYLSKKDFPDLHIGQKITVTGEVTEAYGETRLNAKTKQNIVSQGKDEILVAENPEVGSIDESMEGTLAQVVGQITEVKSTGLYIDDGTGEIKVYFKNGTGIGTENFVLGSTYKITGIVSQTTNGYQILPRGKEDIENMIESVAPEVNLENKNIQPVGSKNYFVPLGVGLIVLGCGVLVKVYAQDLFQLLKRLKEKLFTR